MIKKAVNYLAHLIEEKKGIRRFLVFSAFPCWLILSILFGVKFLKGWRPMMSFSAYYGTFTGVIGTIIGFYFHTRSKEDRKKVIGE